MTNERDRPVEGHFELGAGAAVGLDFTTRYLSLGVGYGPSIGIQRLETSGRDTDVNHTAFASASSAQDIRFRRATITFSENANYSIRNSQAFYEGGPTVLPLPSPQAQPNRPEPSETPEPQAPGEGQAPGADVPGGPGGSEGTPSVDRGTGDSTFHTASLRAQVSVSHVLSRRSTLTESAGYSLSVGVGEASHASYPLAQGIDAGVFWFNRLDVRNSVTTALSAGHAWSETGNRAQLVSLTSTFTHDFNRRTQGYIGGGVAYSRTEFQDDPVPNSIYPTGATGISYTTRLARGTFTMGAAASAGPVLDVTAAKVDPRITAGANVGWSRDRTALYASIGSAVSLTENQNAPKGALNSFYATAGVSYEIGAGFHVDTGVRAFWLEYQDFESIPPSFTWFIGLAWGASVPIINRPTGAVETPAPQ